MTSGVPPGSHLGPVLFSIFINNIKNVIRDSLFLLYADDLKLFYNFRSEHDCLGIQDDLCRVVSWCDSNGLELNISKCKVIRYSRKKIITLPYYYIHNSVLECLFHISDLGIILDSKLTFCSHIKNIVKKSNNMLGFMVRQCSEFDNLKTLVFLYNTILRSNLEYNTMICGVRCIKILFTEFIKFACYKCHIHFDRNNYDNKYIDLFWVKYFKIPTHSIGLILLF
jgi:hypothetical protein